MPETAITLRLLNDDGQGLRIATIFGWDCTAIAAPKTELKSLLKQPELEHAGIYLLLGIDQKTNSPTVYVGKAGSVGARLRQHSSKEWKQVIAIVSDKLNTAHAGYLEGKLIKEADSTVRCVSKNEVASSEKLQEFERAQMDNYLIRIRQLLPVLGCHIFVSPGKDPQPELFCRIKGLTARGQRSSNGFVVFQGSKAVKDLRPSAATRGGWIIKLREFLIQEGVLKLIGAQYEFVKNHEFASPSAAAAVIRGGNANGQTEWKTSSGKTLKALEAAVSLA